MARIYPITTHFLVWFSILLTANGAFSHELLDKAYTEFTQRDQGRAHIKIAKKAYWNVLSNQHEELTDRLEALDKYARLTVYQNEISKKSLGIDNKKAAKAFEKCIKATDYFSPRKIGKPTAAFTYWRSMCIGLWAANVSSARVIMSAGRIREMSDLVSVGMADYEDFDDYGFGRIQAGMYIRSKMLAMFGLYNPAKAIEIIDRSLAQTTIFMSYVLKAEALMELNRKAEALSLLKEAEQTLVLKLRNDELPKDLVAENKIFLQTIREEIQRHK